MIDHSTPGFQTQVVYGAQDSEPITQAYDLQRRLGSVDVHLINRSGHIPWLEQPEAFFQASHDFLSA